MTYKLTRHTAPSPGAEDVCEIEPPGEELVADDVISATGDGIYILWRPAAEMRLEVEGRSVADLEALVDELQALEGAS